METGIRISYTKQTKPFRKGETMQTALKEKPHQDKEHEISCQCDECEGGCPNRVRTYVYVPEGARLKCTNCQGGKHKRSGRANPFIKS